MAEGELYTLPCRVCKETDNAVLVHDYATKEDLWIPLSQVSQIHKDARGDGSVVMTAWIAKKKGLI